MIEFSPIDVDIWAWQSWLRALHGCSYKVEAKLLGPCNAGGLLTCTDASPFATLQFSCAPSSLPFLWLGESVPMMWRTRSLPRLEPRL